MLNRIIKYCIFFIIHFVFVVQSSAQYEILNNNSPKLKWYQINSPHFNIIFEGGFLEEAQRMAVKRAAARRRKVLLALVAGVLLAVAVWLKKRKTGTR